MAGETDCGHGGVDNWFLHDGPFEPPLYRIRRAPPDKILALRASRAAVLARHASRKFDIAMGRAGRPGKKLCRSARAQTEDDGDPGMRVNSRRIAGNPRPITPRVRCDGPRRARAVFGSDPAFRCGADEAPRMAGDHQRAARGAI